MCDANLIVTDVDATWPGTSHDSFVFRNSAIGQAFSGDNRLFPDVSSLSSPIAPTVYVYRYNRSVIQAITCEIHS